SMDADSGTFVEIARGIEADRAKSPGRGSENVADFGGSCRVAAKICRAAAGWIRGICADAGVDRGLRGDFLLGESTEAGDWDSHGAGSIARFGPAHGAGGDHAHGDGRSRAGFGGRIGDDTFGGVTALWSDTDGSADICAGGLG